MKSEKYICFQNRMEYLDVGNAIKSYPIGSILDTDWSSFFHYAKQLQDKISKNQIDEYTTISERLIRPSEAPYYQVAQLYQKLNSKLKDPLLFLFSDQILIQTRLPYEEAFRNAEANLKKYGHYSNPQSEKDMKYFNDIQKSGSMLIAADATQQMMKSYPDYQEIISRYGHVFDYEMIEVTINFLGDIVDTLSKLTTFQSTLNSMVEFSLDSKAFYRDLLPTQRYYLMKLSDFEPFQACTQMYKEVRLERRIFKDDEMSFSHVSEIDSDLIAKIRNSNLDAAIFYCSDNLCALAFLEFDYMCIQNISIRKCEN